MDIVRQKGLTVRELEEKLAGIPDDYAVVIDIDKQNNSARYVFPHEPTKTVYIS